MSNAIISKNALKMVSGCFFTREVAWLYLISGFLLIIAFTIGVLFIV